MNSGIFGWVAIASIISTLIPLLYLFIYRKRQPRQHLILALPLCISFIFDVIGWILAHNHTPNAISNNLYFIVSFPAIMWFYHETLIKRSLKISVRIFTIVFLVLALIFALDQGLHVLNSNTMTLSSILITITSFFFVADLNLMDESSFAKNRFHETNIILNTSLALYYFATIVVFAIADYIFSNLSADDGRLFWSFHNAIHILKNCGIAVAFYLSAKRSYELTNSKV
jgi:hypothetical protein